MSGEQTDSASREPPPTDETDGGDYLRGRIPERWILYPAYLLTACGGVLAANFAMDSPEWSSVPVALSWGVLFVWQWLYGVGFRYHRPTLQYLSTTMVLVVGSLLTFFCLDRAAPQDAIRAAGDIAARGSITQLTWASILTGSTILLLLSHLAFFGRGQRKKS